MTSKLIAFLIVICVAALGAEGYIYRVTHPSYALASFEDPARVSVAYPAPWTKPKWYVNPYTKKMEYALHIDPLYAPGPGFATRWDDDYFVGLSLEFLPIKNRQTGDPRELLTAEAAAPAKPGEFRHQEKAVLTAVKVDGKDAWMLKRTYEPSPIDFVGTPTGPGFFAAVYDAFFGGQPAETIIVLRQKDQFVRIRYIVPGDKIARARYERIFGRVLESLKIKDA